MELLIKEQTVGHKFTTGELAKGDKEVNLVEGYTLDRVLSDADKVLEGG